MIRKKAKRNETGPQQSLGPGRPSQSLRGDLPVKSFSKRSIRVSKAETISVARSVLEAGNSLGYSMMNVLGRRLDLSANSSNVSSLARERLLQSLETLILRSQPSASLFEPSVKLFILGFEFKPCPSQVAPDWNPTLLPEESAP